MGPKYEFTDETMHYDGHILHRIKRLSDEKIGGWIEKESNLSQEGDCWVDDNAKVYANAVVSCNAKVYGDAKVYGQASINDYAQIYDMAEISGQACIYGNAKIFDNAKVYGNAKVFYHAKVYGNARVYENARVHDEANIWGMAQVYGYAKVYDNAGVCGNAQVYDAIVKDIMEICSGIYTDKENASNLNEVVQDFIYKVDESNKLTIGTSYDSIDDFFEDDSVDSYRSHEAIVVLTVDTKMPIIVLEKAEIKDKKVFRFIVDITNEDGDTFNIKSTIDSKEKFNQLLQSTLDALKQYPQFSKYIEDLENVI